MTNKIEIQKIGDGFRGLLYVEEKIVYSDEGKDIYLILQNLGDFLYGFLYVWQ